MRLYKLIADYKLALRVKMNETPRRCTYVAEEIPFHIKPQEPNLRFHVYDTCVEGQGARKCV